MHVHDHRIRLTVFRLTGIETGNPGTPAAVRGMGLRRFGCEVFRQRLRPTNLRRERRFGKRGIGIVGLSVMPRIVMNPIAHGKGTGGRGSSETLAHLDRQGKIAAVRHCVFIPQLIRQGFGNRRGEILFHIGSARRPVPVPLGSSLQRDLTAGSRFFDMNFGPFYGDTEPIGILVAGHGVVVVEPRLAAEVVDIDFIRVRCLRHVDDVAFIHRRSRQFLDVAAAGDFPERAGI